MSLIADSLKKIEKGENETPEKDGGFVAPPGMQKDFGGGKKPKKEKGEKSSKVLPFVLLVFIVVVGGSAAFLYMTGGLDGFFEPEIQPVPLIERNVRETPAKEETTISLNDNGSVENEIVMTENSTITADNTTLHTTIGIEDIFETESAQDMKKSDADNISIAANLTEPVKVAPAVKPDNVTTAPKPVKDTTKATAKVNKTSDKATPSKSNNVTAKKKTDTKAVESKTAKVKSSTNKASVKTTPKSNITAKQKEKTKTVVAAPKPVTINDKMTYTSLISQGESAVDRKDYNSAINIFKKAAEIQNSNVLMGNIASLYIRQGKPAVASEIVIVNKIKDADIVSGLIIEMSSEKHFVQALVLLKYASTHLAPGGQLFYAEGYYYEMQKGYIKAAQYYLKAFEMNPREPAYLYAYARALDYSEQYYKALENYIKVVAMKPDQQLKVLADQRIRSLQNYLRQSK